MQGILSRLFTGSGLSGMVVVAVVYLLGASSSRMADADFQQSLAGPAVATFAGFDATHFEPDQSLWSDSARAHFSAAAQTPGTPVALLKINRLNVLAPVFRGTDKITLNRGIGIVEGSPMPGEPGNVAIAAHRDSFFRPLKDIEVGDVIEVQTLGGTLEFEVSDLSIVDPRDTSVLDQGDTSVLTLITCYPFYFVGSAPERFIVRANLTRQNPVASGFLPENQQAAKPAASGR